MSVELGGYDDRRDLRPVDILILVVAVAVVATLMWVTAAPGDRGIPDDTIPTTTTSEGANTDG